MYYVENDFSYVCNGALRRIHRRYIYRLKCMLLAWWNGATIQRKTWVVVSTGRYMKICMSACVCELIDRPREVVSFGVGVYVLSEDCVKVHRDWNLNFFFTAITFLSAYIERWRFFCPLNECMILLAYIHIYITKFTYVDRKKRRRKSEYSISVTLKFNFSLYYFLTGNVYLFT